MSNGAASHPFPSSSQMADTGKQATISNSNLITHTYPYWACPRASPSHWLPGGVCLHQFHSRCTTHWNAQARTQLHPTGTTSATTLHTSHYITPWQHAGVGYTMRRSHSTKARMQNTSPLQISLQADFSCVTTSCTLKDGLMQAHPRPLLMSVQ